MQRNQAEKLSQIKQHTRFCINSDIYFTIFDTVNKYSTITSETTTNIITVNVTFYERCISSNGIDQLYISCGNQKELFVYRNLWFKFCFGFTDVDPKSRLNLQLSV